jgi:flagellar biosynthesis protein FlhB
MAGDSAQEDRTEAATPRRLERAREEGRVPVSREVHSFVGLAAVPLVVATSTGSTARDMAGHLTIFLAHADVSGLAGPAALHLAALVMLRGAAPFVLAALVGGVASSVLQTGFLISSRALRPDFGRVSPGKGLARLFSTDSLVEACKSLAKVAVMAFALWHVVHADMPALMLAPHWEPQVLLSRILPPVLHMLFVVLAVQGAIAGFDMMWVRLRHAQQMRMTKEDVRDESRETEGDPKVKARIRQIRTQRARRRMLAAVPRATVVITNPTHYAIALAYDRTKNAAPRVVAKGVDSLAARIRELAREHRIPLVANPPLAHALYRVEVDAEIPAEHYQAVAEIIAYVWRLSQRTRGTRRAA